MNPALRNLKIYIGEDFEESYRFLVKATKLPMDLTGYTVVSQVKSQPGDAEPLAEFAALVTGAADGRVTISLPRSVTHELTAQSAFWDLFLIDPDGNARPYLAGTVTILPSVTEVP